MPDYSKGKIYKLVCNTTGLIYIGSTCEPTLARRLAGHKTSYNRFLIGKRSNITSFDVLKNENFEIILIENVVCINKDELHARERFHIESTKCVNKNIPTRTLKEFYHDNIDKRKQYLDDNKVRLTEYNKTYREQNVEKIALLRQNRKDKLKEYNIKNKTNKQQYDKEYRLRKKELKHTAL